MNADDANTIVPGLDDLVIDPLAVGRVGTNKHNRTSPAFHLVGNPPLDRVFAGLGDAVPVVVRRGPVPLDAADVPNRGRTPIIGRVVEAVEHSACHTFTLTAQGPSRRQWPEATDRETGSGLEKM